MLRVTFALALMAVAAVVGITSFTLLNDLQYTQYETEYDTDSEKILDAAVENLHVLTAGARVLASTIGNAFPNSTTWPYVALPGYQHTATEVVQLTSALHIGFAPLVTPEQQSTFETFAYDYYRSDPDIPPSTANHSFGEGIFAVNPNLPNSDKRYHDFGATFWGSPNDILAPGNRCMSFHK